MFARSLFQPTRPLRGATPSFREIKVDLEFQPTRPLRGATNSVGTQLTMNKFQPTRPLRGATQVKPAKRPSQKFQPTRPLRGATRYVYYTKIHCYISTHAPLAGRDTDAARLLAVPWYFNPRAPCGARRTRKGRRDKMKLFQPTRPLRGATNFLNALFLIFQFQPTRPLRGATAKEYKSLCTFLR